MGKQLPAVHNPVNQLPEIAGRAASRQVLKSSAGHLGRTAAKKGTQQLAKSVAKGAGNPAFIAADLLEFGVEKTTGSKTASKATSLAAYAGIGGASGGPPGALIAVGVWGFGQLCGCLFH